MKFVIHPWKLCYKCLNLSELIVPLSNDLIELINSLGILIAVQWNLELLHLPLIMLSWLLESSNEVENHWSDHFIIEMIFSPGSFLLSYLFESFELWFDNFSIVFFFDQCQHSWVAGWSFKSFRSRNKLLAECFLSQIEIISLLTFQLLCQNILMRELSDLRKQLVLYKPFKGVSNIFAENIILNFPHYLCWQRTSSLLDFVHDKTFDCLLLSPLNHPFKELSKIYCLCLMQFFDRT